MKTLYVTDLDGTLLNTQDIISQTSLSCINGLVKNGLPFTYATARSLVSATAVTKGLLLDMPVIVYNGAFIMEPNTGKILHATVFVQNQVETIITAMKQCGISPLIYSFLGEKEQLSWVTDNENEGIRRYLSMRKGDKRLRPLKGNESLYEGTVFYVTCIGEKEELLPVYEFFKNREDFRCTLQQELYRPEYWCEIMPKDATKAKAIEKLKELYSYDRIVSFGDAINDIPMFEISDACYAVENAAMQLREIATGIIPGNDEDGVAKWLSEHAQQFE